MTKAFLSKWKAPGKPRDEWIESWQRAGWLLEPLAASLLELAGDGKMTRETFASGTGSSLLAYDAGARAMALKVLDMLPPGAMPAEVPYHLRLQALDKPHRTWYNVFSAWWKQLRIPSDRRPS